MRAQDDVAEAARQARERKAAQQNSPHRVYSDEDLKRTKILTEEDTLRAAASRAVPATPGKTQVAAEKTFQQPAQMQPQPAEQQLDQSMSSLGEIARKVGQEKEARRAEEAAKKIEPLHYPLDLPKESFAEPKATVGPLAGPTGSLRDDELHSAKRPVPRSASGNASLRVSPFVPRPEIVPNLPRGTAPLATAAAGLQRKQVQPGDNWWKLAHQYLGDAARWAELLRVNPGRSQDPMRLRAGTYIFVPGSVGARAARPGKQVTVRKGDTLWSLAREQLGCSEAWPKLAAANPQLQNINQLQIGATLSIPTITPAVCPTRVSAASRN